MKKPINIVFGLDNNFIKYATVCMYSILKNNKNNHQINFYIISSGINFEYQLLTRRIEKKFDNCKVNFVNIDDSIYKKMDVSGFLNESTYYRFSISDNLKHLDKIIYIDADIIVDGDISELWEQNIDDCILGGITDGPNRVTKKLISNYNLSKSYFNAGVLLINMKKWIENDVSNKSIKLLTEKKYPNNDQDVLNIVTDGKRKLLDPKFNMHTSFFEIDEFFDIGVKINKYNAAIKAPIIIHYTGTKPWAILSIHPYTQKYQKYTLLSGIYNTRDILRILFQKIIFLILPSYQTRKRVRNFILEHLKFIKYNRG